MSQENVDETEEHFDADVEWEMSQATFDQTGPSRGRDWLMDYWRRFWAAWRPGARWEIDELECVSEGQVFAGLRRKSRSFTSGLSGTD